MKDILLIESFSKEEFKTFLTQQIKEAVNQALDKKSRQPILDQEYVTIKDVCDLCHVSRQTVYSWISEGKLTKYKLGQRSTRFKTVEVIELLKKIERKKL